LSPVTVSYRQLQPLIASYSQCLPVPDMLGVMSPNPIVVIVTKQK